MSVTNGIAVGVGVMAGSLVTQSATQLLVGLALVGFWAGLGLGRG